MGKTLCPDAPRLSIAVVVAVVLLMAGEAWMQILVLLAAGAAGAAMHLPQKRVEEALTIPVQPRRPMVFLVVFSALLLLAFLPLAEGSLGWIGSELYRAGALVFGGGHVVLPWLQGSFVVPGHLSADTFLAGYGLAQAMPGPLFTFSAFLGAIEGGWTGAAVAVVAVFLPGTLLVFAGLPLWSYIRSHSVARAALAGVNAGVVGLLLAALYDPVWTSAVHNAGSVAFVLLAWVSLSIWKVPVWILAPGSALVGLLVF